MANNTTTSNKTRLILDPEESVIYKETISIADGADLDAFLKNLQRDSEDIDTGILPMGTIQFRQTRNMIVYVIQTEPKMIQLDTEHGYFSIFVPSHVVKVVLNKNQDGNTYLNDGLCRSFMALAPVTVYSDTLYRSFMPNIYSNGTICFGNYPKKKNKDMTDTQYAKLTADYIVYGKGSDHLVEQQLCAINFPKLVGGPAMLDEIKKGITHAARFTKLMSMLKDTQPDVWTSATLVPSLTFASIK